MAAKPKKGKLRGCLSGCGWVLVGFVALGVVASLLLPDDTETPAQSIQRPTRTPITLQATQRPTITPTTLLPTEQLQTAVPTVMRPVSTLEPSPTARTLATTQINLDGPTTPYYSQGNVNVRSCASTSCSTVGRLARADEIAVLETVTGDTVNGNTSWVATRYQNSLAYVHSSLVSRTKPSPVSSDSSPRTSSNTSSSSSSTNQQLPSCGDPATTTCAALKACYGHGWFNRDHPGYHPDRDSDGDGIACES